MMMRRAPRRGKTKVALPKAARSGSDSKPPELEEFVSKGDYTGAIALLDFKRRTNTTDDTTALWLGYVCRSTYVASPFTAPLGGVDRGANHCLGVSGNSPCLPPGLCF